MKKPVSLLTPLVEDIPINLLQADQDWSWTPAVKVDLANLGSASPTTEYSSQEDNE